MRKLSYCFIILFLVLLFAMVQKSYAADISIGGAAWYSWWDLESNGNEADSSTMLYGPVVSIGFAKQWSLSSIFLYGKYDFDESESIPDVKRIDSDTALNYNINRYIKIFSGVKYMGFTFEDGYHRSVGPALGVGITAPLGANFYALCNASGMYNFGWRKARVHTHIKETGVNTTLALAYYIEPASVTVSLGGRFQYINTRIETELEDDLESYLYGVTMSVVYSFGI